MYVDEAGINLLPCVQKTYAPCGQTPVGQQDCKYSHVSVISGISPQGALIYAIQNKSFDGDAIVEFLKQVLAQFKHQIHIIWDGAKIHAGEAVKNFLTHNPEAKRLQLYRIPPYSPQLNADEQVWNHLKNVKLKNTFFKNLTVLEQNVEKAMAELVEQTDILKSFFRHPQVKW